MASSQATVDEILGWLQSAGDVSAKKMFGEYGLFLDGKMFAVVADDQLFIKDTEAASELAPAAQRVPPYPGAKAYVLIPQEKYEHEDWLAKLIQETVKHIPEPKPQKK